MCFIVLVYNLNIVMILNLIKLHKISIIYWFTNINQKYLLILLLKVK